MSFRTKLLLALMTTLIVAVGSVAWIVSSSLRRAFESVDAERTDALVNEFQREFERSGDDVRQRLQALARSASLQHLAADLSQPEIDPFVHFDTARDFAEAQRLDFLAKGAIVRPIQVDIVTEERFNW